MRGKKTGGRKAGTPNRATAAREKAIAASGLTPLDYMLTLMRDERLPRQERLEAARSAAPYVHSKLIATEASGKNGGPIIHEHRMSFTDDDRARALELFLSRTTNQNQAS